MHFFVLCFVRVYCYHYDGRRYCVAVTLEPVTYLSGGQAEISVVSAELASSTSSSGSSGT